MKYEIHVVGESGVKCLALFSLIGKAEIVEISEFGIILCDYLHK